MERIYKCRDFSIAGFISLPEFEEACTLLNQHTKGYMSHEDILAMAKNMDMNKDGFIDFNEFLEAFRIVDQLGREVNRRLSDDGELEHHTEQRMSRLHSSATDETYITDHDL
jgi:Ca2+-binding EF-hand superfamily protein